MEKEKILNAAREKKSEVEGTEENVAGQDKSLLGDVLGMVVNIAAGASGGGKVDAMSVLGNQIQNIANLAGNVTSNLSARENQSSSAHESQTVARTEEHGGKISGHKPQGVRRNEGRVASVGRNVAEQLRERKK